MVNFRVISEYSGPPNFDGTAQKIASGPLYELSRVQSLSSTGEGVVFWTRKCNQDVMSLGWDADDVAGLIRDLKPANFRDSEWCENGKNLWAACDSYSIVRDEWIQHANRHYSYEYFLKFAISVSGTVVLTVSCHLS
jgi:hypothetical protein